MNLAKVGDMESQLHRSLLSAQLLEKQVERATGAVKHLEFFLFGL